MTSSPSAPLHEILVRVVASDIDELGHVNNTVYLRWVQDVAASHWRTVASAESQTAFAWVVLRHEIDYKLPRYSAMKCCCVLGWRRHPADVRKAYANPASA